MMMKQPVTDARQIAEYLKELKFKKAFLGADEQDVWEKIRRLDEMYRALYQAQEIKYQALLSAARDGGL